MIKQAMKVHRFIFGILSGAIIAMAAFTMTGPCVTVKAATYSSISENITLSGGDTISGTINNCTVTIPAGATVTVTGQITITGTVNFVGGGRLVRIGSFTNASMIKVSSGAVLNIGTSSGTAGVTIDGNNVKVNIDGGGIYCTGGTVNLNSGATVTNHYVNKNDPFGGGIYIQAGTLNMYNGASVTNNTANVINSNVSYGGGGIAIWENATFNMYGGTISGNKATSTAGGTGGGGVYNRGKFNISGGTISGNESGRNGGAVHNDGGANTTANSVMVMTGGLITGNSAVWGGGIEILAKAGLTITGGKINSNICTSGGGGIELDAAGYQGYLKISGSAQITGNTRGSNQDNVYLDKNIEVIGDLSGSIGITYSGASSVGSVFGTITGVGNYSGMENFFYDGNKLVGTLFGTSVKWKSSSINLSGITLSTNSPVTGKVITTTLAPSGSLATYQWYRNNNSSNIGGTLIVGATESSYTPVSADASKYLYVVANGTGGSTGKVVSTATSAVQYPSVATPSFSVAAGTYIGTRNVTITCSTVGAAIYYTTDGSNPTLDSTKYTGPVAVSSTTTIKAIAVMNNEYYKDSEVASAAYIFRNITAAPYTGTYDSKTHDAVTLTGIITGDTVTYSINGTSFAGTCPKYTDAKSYSIYVKVENLSQGTWESGLITAVISRADGSITITGDPSQTYDGNAVSNPVCSKYGTGTVTFTYYNDNSGTIGTALSNAPSAVGTYWVKAVVAEDTNYKAAEATKKFNITNANISGITVAPYAGIYDGTAHNAAAVTGTKDGDTVTYSTDGASYSAVCPQYTNTGSYTVYVKITRTGHTDWESGLKTALISRADGSVTITGDPSKIYDGNAISNPTVSKNGTGTVTFTYYNDNSGTIGTALSDAPSAVGTYWVKAAVAQDTNYKAAEATKKFSITSASISGILVTPYAGAYDAAAHAAAVVSGTVSGDAITYSTDGIKFIDVCPQYKNAGSYPIYIKVTRASHSDWISDLKTVKISRAAGNITILNDISKAYDGSTALVPVINKNGTGEVNITYFADKGGIIGEVLPGAPSAVGIYWVKAVVEQDTNYEAAEVKKTFSITNASIGSITIIPYTNSYDGAAHDAVIITGTVSGDTISFSTDGVNFTDNCPQYTNAGSYPIYIKVTRAGHNDWNSGMKTARINRAAGSITIVNDISKTYDGNTVSGPAITANGTGGVTFSYYIDKAGTLGAVLPGAPFAVGSYWIKAVMEQDINYTQAEVLSKFSIKFPQGTGIKYYGDNTGADTALTTTATVAYGTSEEAAKAALSSSGYAKLYDGSYSPIAISWVFNQAYNGNAAGDKTLTGTVSGSAITGTVSGSALGAEYPVSLTGTITVQTPLTPTPTPTPEPTPAPEPTEMPEPTPAVEKINIDIKQGNTENTVSQIIIERSTDSKGNKTDTVTYQKEKAAETIAKLKEEGKASARIVIPDAGGNVSETTVKIPSDSLEILSEGDIKLQLDTKDAKIDISENALDYVNESLSDDLYFNLIPIKKEELRKEVTERAIFEAGVLYEGSDGNSNISVLGTPMIIDTNMPSTEVDITLPLTGMDIPTDPEEREEFLNHLAVYIEHSDGDREIVSGEIVEYRKGIPGIRFHITKFSTFTIIKTDSPDKSTQADIIKVNMPLKANINGKKIIAAVDYRSAKLNLDLTISRHAKWELYSDRDCRRKAAAENLILNVGNNVVYIKVTAEDGITRKVYTLKVKRKELPRKYLIITNKYDPSDTFTAGVMAYQLGGELVRTGVSDKDAKAMVSYIRKNYRKTDRIYIIGLKQAVNINLEKLLKSIGYSNVKRIGGEDKFETASMVAQHIKRLNKTKVVLVNEAAYSRDAKDIQKKCAEYGYPILCIRKDSLTAYTINILKKIKPYQIYILGDKTEISSKAEAEIKKATGLRTDGILRITSARGITK